MDVSLCKTLAELDAVAWNSLSPPHFPFADFAHLIALERNECVGPRAGWLPFAATAHASGRLVGAMPFYLKNNSYGEFIFDHAWARAYEANGLSYFPKLVVAVPFTPATGQKILTTDASDAASLGLAVDDIRKALLEQALTVAHATRCSSAHVLFIPPEDIRFFEKEGWIVRHSFQYHWKNDSYGTFESFLAALTKKRRKQIALERRQLASEPGVSLETREGDDLTLEDARFLAKLYADTNLRYGSLVCLNEDFFAEIFQTMKKNIVLFVAKRDGERVAAAINFRKGNRLYGRYWGCTEDIRNLHFELCYYRALEYAIEANLEAYEAGAQGEHKIPRGFAPTLTYSAHKVFHPAFREAIARAVEAEKNDISALFAEFAEHSPYLAAGQSRASERPPAQRTSST
ncbi:MAG: GNAT family N-acetyltransferase [Silvanigrellales bacterium]|nr:GNAT family N-acetyltransferase [Silvanigrellales bacterium]